MTRALVVLCFVLAPSAARADVVAIDVTPCPEGAWRVNGGHGGGSWCAPHVCDDDTCDGICVEVALCIGTGTHYVDHGHTSTSPMPTRAEHVEAYGPCEADGSCARGACSREIRCAPPPPPPPALPRVRPDVPAPEPTSATCAASPSSSVSFTSLALALSLAACLRARRSRSS